jgi:energy-coupling factor transporter ATP-binding protein EcfA2
MPRRSEWHAHQLAEFLGNISAYDSEPAALDGAVERAAEAMEAEVAAVVRDGVVLASVGFRAGHVPVAAVAAAAAASDGPGGLDVPGVGRCPTVTVAVNDDTALLVARSGDTFTTEERLMLRAMGRILAQALRMLDTLAVLKERQTLLERLFRIQRSISHRMPIGEVLDSITQGAAELLGDEVARLSYGEQRQLEVGVALATRPQLLLLDEPTAGMSPEETQRMTRLLTAVPREVTILIIEHDMDVVFSLADRITVLHYGEVLVDGTPDAVRADPRVYEVYLGGRDDA